MEVCTPPALEGGKQKNCKHEVETGVMIIFVFAFEFVSYLEIYMKSKQTFPDPIFFATTTDDKREIDLGRKRGKVQRKFVYSKH